MGAINLENIKPGMVLASDAKDLNGRVLLKAGTELTEKHLRVFKIWGVSEAEIVGVDAVDVVAEAAAQIDPARMKDAEGRLQQLFALTDKKHPAIAELMRLIMLRAVRSDSTKGADHD
jgi:hypothetical protein